MYRSPSLIVEPIIQSPEPSYYLIVLIAGAVILVIASDGVSAD